MIKKICTAALAVILLLLFTITFNRFRVRETFNTEDSVQLPIIMYHSILADEKLSGKYVTTPTRLDEDIKYLYSLGYETISAMQLIDFVENNAALPQKPVMITFDDGCYNNYSLVLDVLKNNNAHAVMSVVGEYSENGIDNTSYGYLRYEDISKLYESGLCDIGNHSYSFHKIGNRQGAKRMKYEAGSDYKNIFTADTKKLQDILKKECGITPVVYTYPYGFYSPESTDYLKEMGFKISLSCSENINTITHDPNCLFLLNRYNRPHDISTQAFFNKILERSVE